MDINNMGDLSEEQQALVRASNARTTEIRKLILAEYKKMIDKIGENHFKALEDVIEKGTGKTVNTESVVINFRQKLYEAIELKFNRNWDELELDASVSNLNYSKAVTQDEEKKWRPMGQSVDDQLLPAMTNALNRKRTMLQRQVDYQNRLITEIVPRLEQTRQDLRGRSEQRRQILAQIEKDTEVLKVADGKIDEINQMLRR